MTEPTTTTRALIVPDTGDLPGTWGSAALNPDLVAIDAMFGCTTAISLTNVPVTLTVPSGFTATPSSGPTQSQSAIIKFTGTLSGNCIITFPMPGFYIVENRCTVGAFYVKLVSAGGGNAIGAPPGKKCHVYNDGTDMDYVNMPDVGTAYDLHGVTALPAWMSACTVLPYLIKDGSAKTIATYPALAALLGTSFGGDGVTTFGVPDERNRMRLPVDTTVSGVYSDRVTTAASGINGRAIAAAGGLETVGLTANQNGPHTHNVGPDIWQTNAGGSIASGGGGTPGVPNTITTGLSGSGAGHLNMPPTIVSFLALIKT